jgi:hypothetical protein
LATRSAQRPFSGGLRSVLRPPRNGGPLTSLPSSPFPFIFLLYLASRILSPSTAFNCTYAPRLASTLSLNPLDLVPSFCFPLSLFISFRASRRTHRSRFSSFPSFSPYVFSNCRPSVPSSSKRGERTSKKSQVVERGLVGEELRSLNISLLPLSPASLLGRRLFVRQLTYALRAESPAVLDVASFLLQAVRNTSKPPIPVDAALQMGFPTSLEARQTLLGYLRYDGRRRPATEGSFQAKRVDLPSRTTTAVGQRGTAGRRGTIS